MAVTRVKCLYAMYDILGGNSYDISYIIYCIRHILYDIMLLQYYYLYTHYIYE